MKGTLLALTAGLTLAAVSGCGPDTSTPAAAPPASHAATSQAPASQAPAAAAAVTPEALCAALSVAKAAEISGFAISKAEPSMSGDVAVCTYKAPVSGTDLAKFIVEYQPNGKTLYNYTKSKGTPVSGVGHEAVYFKSSGELFALLDGTATFHCYVMDVRMHHSDPKAGAVAVAHEVLPHLTGA
jgi:hypothetical protein